MRPVAGVGASSPAADHGPTTVGVRIIRRDRVEGDETCPVPAEAYVGVAGRGADRVLRVVGVIAQHDLVVVTLVVEGDVGARRRGVGAAVLAVGEDEGELAGRVAGRRRGADHHAELAILLVGAHVRLVAFVAHEGRRVVGGQRRGTRRRRRRRAERGRGRGALRRGGDARARCRAARCRARRAVRALRGPDGRGGVVVVPTAAAERDGCRDPAAEQQRDQDGDRDALAASRTAPAS